MRTHLKSAAAAATTRSSARRTTDLSCGGPKGPRKMRSVREAARAAARETTVLCKSIWQTTVHPGRSHGPKAKPKKGPWRKNLTTTTASGYTNAYDWLAKAMGQGPSFTFATATGAATASSATSLTNSGASFPTSGQGLAGSIVCCWISTTVMVYGVILSNTATVLTVDQWYSATSTSGAAGTTPASTAPYIILPGQNPAAWMAVTANTFTPSTADTYLAGELTTNGFSRAVGTYSHTAAASTYALVHLWTATGTETINNEAQFGGAVPNSSSPYGGVMPFESAEPSPPTLVSGDTLQNTVTITI